MVEKKKDPITKTLSNRRLSICAGCVIIEINLFCIASILKKKWGRGYDLRGIFEIRYET